MHAININNLKKTFKQRQRTATAIDKLSFAVAEGEAFGLIGANGAGKSTTIKCILDIIRPDAGSIEIFGRPSSSYQCRKGVAFVAENPLLNELLTATETLQLALQQHGKASNAASITYWLKQIRYKLCCCKAGTGFIQRYAPAGGPGGCAGLPATVDYSGRAFVWFGPGWPQRGGGYSASV